jgi:hypothetical protein
MTAPRVCRSCGADLALDVRWCTLCFAPITAFAARAPLHDGFAGAPHADVRTSRWTKAGPLSFGPVGRISITVFVLLMGPWTPSFFSLLYAPVWFGFGIVVLRQVWRREALADDAPPTKAERFRQRHPILGFRFDGTSIAIVLGALLVLTVAILMVRADTAGFYRMVGLLALIGLAAFIAWVVDV